MAFLSQRFLIVFNHKIQNANEFSYKIQHYRNLILRSRQIKSQRAEYFIAFVAPYVPTYALQTSEMFNFATRQVEQNKKILLNIGKELEIQPQNQFLLEGIPDIQAWQLARNLKIDKVFGYSKKFIKLLNTCKTVQYAWANFSLLGRIK